jgi:hypothetical protein
MTDRVQNHDFGLVYVGAAEPLYCGACGAEFCVEANLKRHMRQCHEHKRRERP